MSYFTLVLGLVCRIDPFSGGESYYHYDWKGSTIAISDSVGNLVKGYYYTPFGDDIQTKGSINFENPFTYVGKYGIVDDKNGYFYMRARYYQPSTGRFISSDPVWNTNLFPYADNDPINKIDPNGEFALTDDVGLAESFIPVWGSYRDAMYNAGQGNYLAAGGYTALAVSEVLGFGLAIKGIQVAKAGSKISKIAVHGNSLKSLRPTTGYKLYSSEGTFLKNGITSKLKPESRYSKAFMQGKRMEKILFPNRKAAWDWELLQNKIKKGPLNKNNH